MATISQQQGVEPGIRDGIVTMLMVEMGNFSVFRGSLPNLRPGPIEIEFLNRLPVFFPQGSFRRTKLL